MQIPSEGRYERLVIQEPLKHNKAAAPAAKIQQNPDREYIVAQVNDLSSEHGATNAACQCAEFPRAKVNVGVAADFGRQISVGHGRGDDSHGVGIPADLALEHTAEDRGAADELRAWFEPLYLTINDGI